MGDAEWQTRFRGTEDLRKAIHAWLGREKHRGNAEFQGAHGEQGKAMTALLWIALKNEGIVDERGRLIPGNGR